MFQLFDKGLRARLGQPQVCRVLLLTLVLGASSATGQTDKDPTPRLVLNTGGPNAQVQQLIFSADSQRLFAAGRDKAIHHWQVGWDQAGQGMMSYTGSWHWEITRGTRGQIYAMAASPNGTQMAIGGLSVRQVPGDISIVDADTGEITASLPAVAVRTADPNRADEVGHAKPVVSLGYSPSGSRIVSADNTGRVFVWTKAAQGTFTGRQLLAGLQPENSLYPVMFWSEDRVLSPYLDTGGNVRLAEYDLNGRRVSLSPMALFEQVGALASSPQGQWAAADWGRNIWVGRQGSLRSEIKLAARYKYVTSLAFSPDGLLAVASNEFKEDNVGGIAIQLFDSETGAQVDELRLSDRRFKLWSVVFSPDGQSLAFHDDEHRDVAIVRLKDQAGNPLPKPFTSSAIQTNRSLGAPVQRIEVSANGKSVVFGTDTSDDTNTLELADAYVRQSDELPNTLGGSSYQDWDLQFINGDRPIASITRGGQPVSSIPWDLETQGPPSVWTFLGDGVSPLAIAIGTDLTYGIFLYDLSNGNRPRLLRWFYDHSDVVSALAVTPDNRLLLSGSFDGTMKIWSLDSLYQVDPSFAGAGIWGASLAVEGGAVVARRVNPQGVLYGKGVREGDQITFVRGWDASGARVEAANPPATGQQILAVLASLNPFREAVLAVNGQFKVIRPGWEPIVTVYADRRDEWAIWHPRGYFNASAAEGGDLFGWLFNEGPDRSPRVLTGSQLQKEFERPDIIQGLLNGGNIDQLLAANNLPAQNIGSVARTVPEVKIISPTPDQQPAADGRATIVARVRFDANDRNRYLIRASVNGFRLGSPSSERNVGGEVEFTWSCTLGDRLNDIEVMASERGGAMAALYDTHRVTVRGVTREERPYRLHMLMLASKQYPEKFSNGRDGLGALAYPVDDVTEVENKLRSTAVADKAAFVTGEWIRLIDRDITASRVQQEIAKLDKMINGQYSNDRNLLVVYLAGHGLTVQGEYHYVTVSTKSMEDKDIQAAGIPWSLLSQAGERNCQLVYMIDTCHSGMAVVAQDRSESVIADSIKGSIRDPLRSQGIVVAAATGRDVAIESAEFGHGAFTYAVLRGLDGKADGIQRLETGKFDTVSPDKTVDLTELIQFVRNETYYYAGGKQRPTVAPERLLDKLNLPILRL